MSRAFDHLVLAVDDLDKASRFYECLGFTLTPIAQHPFGTGNRLAQMQGCFLELLAVTKPKNIAKAKPGAFSFGDYNRNFLKYRQGMSMMVLQTKDAAGDRDEFKAAGLDTYEMFDFSRLAKLPDGSEATVGFTLAFASVPEMPQAVAFTCQQWRPDLFWKPEYQIHANGAERIAEVFILADDDEPAQRFLRGLDADPVNGQVNVMTPAQFNARFPNTNAHQTPDEWGASLSVLEANKVPQGVFAGYRIAVSSIEAVRTCMEENAVDYVDGPESLWVSHRLSFGCVIEFSEKSEP